MSSDQYPNGNPYDPRWVGSDTQLRQWPAPTGASAGVGPAQDGRLEPESTDATRYLCAAPHLDERFAQKVLDEVLHQPRRAVAPSFGFGLGPVIRHCVLARRRSLLRDAVVTALLLLGLLLAFWTGVAVLVSLLGLWLLVRGARLLLAHQPAAGVVSLLLGTFLVPLGPTMLLGGVLSLLSRPLYDYPYGYPELDESGSDGSGVFGLGWIWVLVVLGVWCAYFVHRLVVHHTIAVELTPEAFDPARAPAIRPAHERRLDYIERAQRGNVTTYSEEAGGRPFIGFGQVVTDFSLVSPLLPAGQPSGPGESPAPVAGASPLPFSVDHLYEALRTGLAELSDDRLPRDEVVPHLSVHDHVFVAGRLPPTSPFVHANQPRYQLSADERTHLQHSERGRVRHYQSVRISAWSGELEVTVFVHAAVRGRILFVEFVATMVPGIRAAYHRIDTYDRVDAATAGLAAARAAGDVLSCPTAVGRLVRAGWHALRAGMGTSVTEARISRQLAFDYGCRASVRELAADFTDPVQFQLYDAGERISLVRRRLLQTLVSFLVDQGYDVADLVGQASTVINNSTTITHTNSNSFTNSTIVGSPVAAGSFARASTAGGPVPSTPAAPPPAASRPAPGGRT